MRARDIMSSPVVTVRPDSTVKHAAKLLASYGFTALPVLDSVDNLIGVVSEADLVGGRFPRGPGTEGTPEDPRVLGGIVGEVMTTPAISMEVNADAWLRTVRIDLNRTRSVSVASWILVAALKSCQPPTAMMPVAVSRLRRMTP